MAKSIVPEWRAICICLFVCIGAFQFGYDGSYFSGILVMPPFLQLYGKYHGPTAGYIVSAKTQSIVTSIINVGEFLGAVSAFVIGDRFGLRGGLFISSAIVIVGTTLQVAGNKIGLLIAGRLVLGYAVGLISCFVPLYTADCAPARFRGALVSMYQFILGLGLILGVCVDYSTKDRQDTGSFRIPMAVQYVFPLTLLPGLILFAPESPRWLAFKNRIPECEAALKRLNGKNSDVQDQVEAINWFVHRDACSREGSWSEIFKWGSEGRKAYLGFALQALQQASGVNFITGYGVYFFSTVGIKNPFLIQVGLYLCGIPATWVSQYSIEHWGRRPMLIISGLCIVAMVFIFLITFSLAWGPTVWVVCSEISTGRNRGRLMSISTGSNWLFNWLVSFTFPYLYDADAANLGARVGFIYGSLMLSATVWVYFLLPETSQRSLEDIDEMFEKGVSARKFSLFVFDRSTEQIDPKRGVV